jgi:hypothetical protein
MDLILGDSTLRQGLEKGIKVEGLGEDDLKNYLQWRAPYLLYQ